MKERVYLTFADLEVGSQFLLENTDMVYIKMNPRKRSKERPFVCNAKTLNWSSTVKSGYILPETPVFKYDNGPFVWVDSECPTPAGWITASNVWELRDKVHFQINTVSLRGEEYSLNHPESLLSQFLAELELRLRNYYIGDGRATGISGRYLPVIEVHDSQGQILNTVTQKVAKRIASVVQECSDFVNKHGAYSE